MMSESIGNTPSRSGGIAIDQSAELCLLFREICVGKAVVEWGRDFGNYLFIGKKMAEERRAD